MRLPLGDRRAALRRALEVRQQAGRSPHDPVCVFDFVDQLGIDLWFVDAASLEGMYCKEPVPRILLGAQRPRGRQAFTCAHEVGHHVFGHGTRCDELTDSAEGVAANPEEAKANVFGGYLLMPRAAVVEAFARRGWTPQDADPVHLYVVAGQMGVGYATLVNHLAYSLNLIGRRDAGRLLKVTPASIRERLLGAPSSEALLVVDEAWNTVAADLRVGEQALLDLIPVLVPMPMLVPQSFSASAGAGGA